MMNLAVQASSANLTTTDRDVSTMKQQQQLSTLRSSSSHYDRVNIGDGGFAILGDFQGAVHNHFNITLSISDGRSACSSSLDSKDSDGDQIMRDATDDEATDSEDMARLISRMLTRHAGKSNTRPTHANAKLQLQRRTYSSSPQSITPPTTTIVVENLIRNVDTYIMCSLDACTDQDSRVGVNVCQPVLDSLIRLYQGKIHLIEKMLSGMPTDLGPPNINLLFRVLVTATCLAQDFRGWTGIAEQIFRRLQYLVKQQFRLYHPLRFVFDSIAACYKHDKFHTIPWGSWLSNIFAITSTEPRLNQRDGMIVNVSHFYNVLKHELRDQADFVLLHEQRLGICINKYGYNSYRTTEALRETAKAYAGLGSFDKAEAQASRACYNFVPMGTEQYLGDLNAWACYIKNEKARVAAQWIFTLRQLKHRNWFAAWDITVTSLELYDRLLLNFNRSIRPGILERMSLHLTGCEALAKELSYQEQFVWLQQRFPHAWEAVLSSRQPRFREELEAFVHG